MTGSGASRLRIWAIGWIKSIAVALVVWFALSTFVVKAFRTHPACSRCGRRCFG